MSDNKAGIAARRAAVKLLCSVLQNKRSLDEAIGSDDSQGPFNGLDSRDRGFAIAITATALRRKGQIDHILSQFLEKSLPKKCGPLKEILIASTAQLIFLNTPPHAVIDMAVRLCKKDRVANRFHKLANAVLRRVAERGAEINQSLDEPLINLPDWLKQRWLRSYGTEITQFIAAAHQVEAPLDLSVKSQPDSWAKELGGIVLPNGSVRLNHKGRVDLLQGYDKGEWWVQDMAASLCAPLLGDVRGLKVADLCAAPGGKTAQLSHAGAQVTAVDISSKRLERLRENLNRLELKANLVQADILEWKPSEMFDSILLDAPCSATGTIRRHPDIPHLKSADDIYELSQIQRKAISQAFKMLKPGGLLVYCTCSLEPEEGLDQISKFLKDDTSFQLVPISNEDVSGKSDWLQDGCLRTLPHLFPHDDIALSGMDGFFAARLRKI